MEWTLQPFSRKSAATGQSFEAGEVVISFVYKDEKGVLQRLDLRQSDLETSTLPENILGRWTHAVKNREDRSQAKQERLQSPEACFLSLFQEESQNLEEGSALDGPSPEEAVLRQDKAILKQLLALMLERKRVLRPKSPQGPSNSLSYTHVASQTTYTIPLVNYSRQDLERVTESLKRILTA